MTETSRRCPKCGIELHPEAIRCPYCGFEQPKKTGVCSVCGKNAETVFLGEIEFCKKDLLHFIRGVKISTTPYLDGYKVLQNMGICTAVVVLGTGLISELTSGISDVFGARSAAFEGKLTEAKNLAMEKIGYSARETGADAVIGLVINLTEFSNNRIGLVVYGTMVKTEII
jgi:uncharacterized protein YbjQ (UPF0145 family)